MDIKFWKSLGRGKDLEGQQDESKKSRDAILHELWTRDVGTPGYDKEKWKELSRILWEGINAVDELEKQKRPHRVELDEGLNRLRKGGVNAPPPVDAVPPPAPPPQRKKIGDVGMFSEEGYQDLTKNARQAILMLKNVSELLAKNTELEKKLEAIKKVRIFFSEPPGPDSSFVEVENEHGESIDVGTWSQEGDLHVLKLNEIDLAVKK